MTFYNLPDTDVTLEWDKKVQGIYISRGLGGKPMVARTETLLAEPLINVDYALDGTVLGIELFP